MRQFKGKKILLSFREKMQLDVGSEPYLSTAQALCLFISHTFYYKSFENWQRMTAIICTTFLVCFSSNYTDRWSKAIPIIQVAQMGLKSSLRNLNAKELSMKSSMIIKQVEVDSKPIYELLNCDQKLHVNLWKFFLECSWYFLTFFVPRNAQEWQ